MGWGELFRPRRRPSEPTDGPLTHAGRAYVPTGSYFTPEVPAVASVPDPSGAERLACIASAERDEALARARRAEAVLASLSAAPLGSPSPLGAPVGVWTPLAALVDHLPPGTTFLAHRVDPDPGYPPEGAMLTPDAFEEALGEKLASKADDGGFTLTWSPDAWWQVRWTEDGVERGLAGSTLRYVLEMAARGVTSWEPPQ